MSSEDEGKDLERSYEAYDGIIRKHQEEKSIPKRIFGFIGLCILCYLFWIMIGRGVWAYFIEPLIDMAIHFFAD